MVARTPGKKKMPTERIRIQSVKMRALINGEISVSDMDDEELAKGYFKAEDGTFRGRPPLVVPKAIHDEITRRLLERGQEMFSESFQKAIETLTNIATDAHAEPKDRLNAAKYVIERVAGKTPDKVEVRATEPWRMIIEDIIVRKGENE